MVWRRLSGANALKERCCILEWRNDGISRSVAHVDRLPNGSAEWKRLGLGLSVGLDCRVEKQRRVVDRNQQRVLLVVGAFVSAAVRDGCGQCVVDVFSIRIFVRVSNRMRIGVIPRKQLGQRQRSANNVALRVKLISAV